MSIVSGLSLSTVERMCANGGATRRGRPEIASATSRPASSGLSAGIPSYCLVGEIIGVRFTTISMPLVRTPMISPTRQYEGIPALTPAEAGRLVAEAITGRPRRVAPPFAHIISTVDTLSPETMDAVRNRVYRMFPE